MSRFADVSLFSLVHDDEEATESAQVPFAERIACARVPRFRNMLSAGLTLATEQPLTHVMLASPETAAAIDRLVNDAPPDLVVAYCSGMAPLAMQPPLVSRPFVLDMVDVDSWKWRELAGRSSFPKSWLYNREARTLGRFEAEATARARMTLVINERERDALRTITTTARVRVIANGIDTAAFRPPTETPSTSAAVVFCGVMDYAPNSEGVCWFVREVWPLVKASRPDATFIIVGARPTPRVQDLAREDTSITVTGAVPQVQPYLWRSAVSIAPLHVALGLQNKVMEALAAGLPAVITPSVQQGLPAPVRRGCIEASTSAEFAEAVLTLLNRSPAERRELATRANIGQFTWESALQPLEDTLREAAWQQGLNPHPSGDRNTN